VPIELDEPKPRSLPVIVLADTSGSMGVDGKLEVLNDSLRRMVDAFRQLSLPATSVGVAVITFGGEQARIHQEFADVDALDFQPLGAGGRTPMGSAFELATTLLEDRDVLPERSYQPNLVLVSDGIPTDDWQGPLERLNAAPRASRAFRFAVGIGADLKLDVLERFAGSEGQVVPASEVEMLTEFFRYVTYTVTQSVAKLGKSQAEMPTFRDFPTDDVIEF
jgi:uncharacterized protein YegL